MTDSFNQQGGSIWFKCDIEDLYMALCTLTMIFLLESPGARRDDTFKKKK